jgi:hypothetical protein
MCVECQSSDVAIASRLKIVDNISNDSNEDKIRIKTFRNIFTSLNSVAPY